MHITKTYIFQFIAFSIILCIGPGDYTPVERSLIFTSNVQEHSVSVALTDDDLFEDSEHFFASLVLEPTDLNVQLDLALAELSILDTDGIG